MPHDYTEDQLVEQPAIGLFAELGWTTVSAMEETFGTSGTLGRETKGEVVLVPRLRAALERLNPGLPPEAIIAAVDDLTRDRSVMSLEAANREVYLLLKDGIKVPVLDSELGGQKTERLRVVDWENPANNDFLLVSQFSVTGALYTCRPDLVGFVNGLPLIVTEFKKPGVPARVAFDENLSHYKQQIPGLFWFNALLIASNGTESRVGSLTADWERFFEWKRIASEDEPARVSLEVMIRGTCDKTRFLDLVENFTLFSEHKAGLVKIIAQNHQFIGVNNAIVSMLAARAMGHGRGGVFWQTQGSGKSFSMVFFAQKVLRKLAGNWTFVVVTDRVDLDDQIATTFKACGAVSEAEGDECHAESGAHLRELLRGNHRYVFSLIQKFQSTEVLCDRADVIAMTDESHRSQYDTLAMNMRAAIPRALFVAFTGTPLIAGEERTKDVFGDYVSIYDFQQSVEDGATVPLFYENRTPELQLVNPDLNEDIYNLIEEAELDADQEAKLERELGRQYHILTRDDRLDTVAKDIVRHFLGRGFIGKAMVVSIDKATALEVGHADGSKGAYNQSAGAATFGTANFASDGTLGAATTGTGNLTGGTMSVTTLNIGTRQTGSLTLSGSGVLNLAGNATVGGAAGSSGTLNLSNGTINLSSSGGTGIRLGQSGAGAAGTFNMTGGTINSTGATVLEVGYFDGYNGAYNQSAGAATFDTANFASLNTLGAATTGTGNLTGGTMSVTTLNIGTKGTGSFTLSGSGVLNLAGAATVGGAAGSSGTLNLNGGTVNLTSNSSALTLGATGVINANGVSFSNQNAAAANVTVGANMVLGAGGLTAAPSSGATRWILFTGNLSGTGGFTANVTTGSQVSLYGSNTFAGGVTIQGGYLGISNDSAIPVGSALAMIGNLSMSANATVGSLTGTGLIFTSGGPYTITAGYGNASSTFAGTSSNGVALAKTGTGTLTLTNALAHTAGTTIANGVLQIGNGSTTGSVSGNITNNSALVFNRSNALAYNGTISGTGSVTKSGAGTLTLSAANTYNGTTTISAGTLLLSATGSLASPVINNNSTLDVSAVSGFTLASGQSLTGNGTVIGAVSVGSGTLAIGNSAGTMTFNNNLTLTLSSTSNFEVSAWTPGSYDLALGGAGSQTVTFGGTLNVNFGGSFSTLGSAKIFDFETYNSAFTTKNFTGLASGYSASFNDVDGMLTVVPEPATWALLAFSLTTVMVLRRRRNS